MLDKGSLMSSLHQSKPFLANHGAQIQSQKKWNTGTVDFGKINRQIDNSEDEYDLRSIDAIKPATEESKKVYIPKANNDIKNAMRKKE